MVGLLPVEKCVGQLKLGHVYTIFYRNAPVYMKSNFHISNSRTRNSVYNFNITRVGSFSKDSLYYTGAKLRNDYTFCVILRNIYILYYVFLCFYCLINQ